MDRLTKTLVAKMYGVSRPTLVKWIKGNSALYNDLKAQGWTINQRLFSPHQVDVLIYYLGDPNKFKGSDIKDGATEESTSVKS